MSRYIALIDESGCKYKAATEPADDADFGLALAIILNDTDYVRFRR